MAKVLLKDVVARIKDKVDRNNTALEYYIGGEHFDYGEITVPRKGEIAGSTIGPAFHMRFQPNDVLLMSRNPHLRKAGMVDFEGICSDVSYVCRSKDENILLQSYLPFIFQTDHFWTFAEANKKGSTNFFLNWSDFEKYEFDLPNIDRQRELVGLLWAVYDTKRAYQRLLLETDNLVKSQFIEMFGDASCKQNMYPMVELNEVCSIIQDGEHATVKRVDKGNLFISSRNIKTEHKIVLDTITYVSDEDFSKIRKRFAPQENDILLTCAGTIGNSAIVPNMEPFVADRGLTMLRPINEKILPIYLHSAIMSEYLQTQMKQGTRATALSHLYLKNIRTLKLILPPLEVQNEFARIVEQSDKSKFELKQSIERVTALMKSLML